LSGLIWTVAPIQTGRRKDTTGASRHGPGEDLAEKREEYETKKKKGSVPVVARKRYASLSGGVEGGTSSKLGFS